MISKSNAKATKFTDESELVRNVATRLVSGEVIGWFQGRMEFGPRALGNRSILGDPRSSNMQERINSTIKKRESFRPFAPAVIEESAGKYFEVQVPSPYMLFVVPIATAVRSSVPEDFNHLSWKDRLNYRRSSLQAVTHVDFSARVQTVSRSTNQRFHQLLSEFEKQTGFPVLINTSFNVRGEPIVCTPIEAHNCFMRSEMDTLVIGDYVFEKNMQPEVQRKNALKLEYQAD